MRLYETVFVVNPQADDATIDRQVNAVLDIIKSDSGEIVFEERMGTRRLAYPIENLTQGFYCSVVFNANPTVLPKMDRHYKLEEPYIRYMTIKFEGDPSKLGIREEIDSSRDGEKRYNRNDDDSPRPGQRTRSENAPEKSVEEKKDVVEKTEHAPAVETAPIITEPAPAAETAPIKTETEPEKTVPESEVNKSDETEEEL